MCLKIMGARKNWAMSPFFCTPLFFWHLFLPSALYNGYIFPCSKVNEGECGVVAELILGKRIVSKSSLSLHTQNFKLKKKLFQISFLNSFINAIFAWKLWVRERTQLHERWRRGGRGSKVVSSLYTPSFLAPILSLRSYYASCRLNFQPRPQGFSLKKWVGQKIF